MKNIILSLLLATAVISTKAADVGPFSVSTFGAYKLTDFTANHEEFGAGVDVGLSLNKHVSAHLSVVGYSTDEWRGASVDEGSLGFQATLFTSENKRLSLYGLGGVTHELNCNDWAIGGGLGLKANITDRIHIGSDAQIRAWFDDRKDLFVRAFAGFSF